MPLSATPSASLSYHQASLVVEHLVAAHGTQALGRLLRAYGEGRDTETAIREALGVPLTALQETFTAFVEKRFAPLRAALGAPEDVDLTAETSLQAIRALAAEHAGSYPVQLALAQCSRMPVTAMVRCATRPMPWRR